MGVWAIKVDAAPTAAGLGGATRMTVSGAATTIRLGVERDALPATAAFAGQTRDPAIAAREIGVQRNANAERISATVSVPHAAANAVTTPSGEDGVLHTDEGHRVVGLLAALAGVAGDSTRAALAVVGKERTWASPTPSRWIPRATASPRVRR